MLCLMKVALAVQYSIATVNDGWWPHMILADLVGQLTAITSDNGLDSVVRMAGEVKRASKTVPIPMISFYMLNFDVNFVLYLTLSYHLPDPAAAFEDPSYYPATYVLRQAMASNWLLGLLSVATLLILASNVVYLAAVTRDLYAFSRNGGLPSSAWFATVDPKRHVPINVCITSSKVAICVSLIYLGNSVAYYAFTSLVTVAMMATYHFSIAYILWRRIIHPETLPPAKFSLDR